MWLPTDTNRGRSGDIVELRARLDRLTTCGCLQPLGWEVLRITLYNLGYRPVPRKCRDFMHRVYSGNVVKSLVDPRSLVKEWPLIYDSPDPSIFTKRPTDKF